MKRLFGFLIRMSLPWLFVYLWLDYEAEGAFNVLAFYVYALLPIAVVLLIGSIKPSAEVLKMKPMPRLFTVIDNVLDLALTLLFAWQGHFALAAVSALLMFLAAVTRMFVKEARTKAAAAA